MSTVTIFSPHGLALMMHHNVLSERDKKEKKAAVLNIKSQKIPGDTTYPPELFM